LVSQHWCFGCERIWYCGFEQMTREEIEKQMDELARKYVETHNRQIIEELYKLSRELEKLDKESG
jgi:hypothetical protein